MNRVSIPVTPTLALGNQRGSQSGYPVEVSATLRYKFMCVNNNLFYAKSTNGGFTWEPMVQLVASILYYSVWFDKWTPGDSGNLIHITYVDTPNDDVIHVTLNVTNDNLSSPVTVVNLTSTGTIANDCISISKMRGGNLLIVFDIDGGTETGCYRSTDGGANWTSRANPNEASGDYYLLFPGFAADNQDAILIFWDRSANEISRKLYDDSADSWAETSIATSMTAISTATCAPQFAGTVDSTNSKIYLAAWTNRDTNGADLKLWSITESAITALTDVVTDSADDQQMCAIARDRDSGALTCFYGGKSDGSETAGTAITICGKVSLDNGSTWGAEAAYSVAARNFQWLMTSMISVGPPMPAFAYDGTVEDGMYVSVALRSAEAGYQIGMS